MERREKMRSKRAIKNIMAAILLQIITFICGLIVPRLILSQFGSNVNGLINSITQFLAYISLLESGFGPVVKSILYKPIAQKDKKQIASILKSTEKFFRTIALIFIMYIVIMCLIYPNFVSQEFDTKYTISLILIIGISTFAEYFFGMTYRLYLQADQKNYVISSIQIGTIILNTIATLLLIKLGASIQLVKLASASIFILRPILQNLYVKKKYDINFNDVDNNYKIKQKWDGLAQHIAGVIHNNTDITILTIFSDIKEVSVYSIYFLIITGVKNICYIFSNAIEAGFGDMIAKDEKENLNKKFSMYEFIYFTVVTIVYACTASLIVDFVRVYTNGINDIEYVRYAFAYILVFAYFIYTIKTPYNVLAYTAGKFKETRRGAWVEAISNLIISIILVQRLGIVGVAIGTLVSVTIRGIELLIFASKNILNRKTIKTFLRAFISIIQFLIIIVTSHYLIALPQISYGGWIIIALKVFVLAVVVIMPFNLVFYKNEFKDFLNSLKGVIGKINKKATL